MQYYFGEYLLFYLDMAKHVAEDVSYFKQFPVNFLKPYGEAADSPTSATLERCLGPHCCEWYGRPDVALSELPETIHKNIELLTSPTLLWKKGLSMHGKQSLSSTSYPVSKRPGVTRSGQGYTS